MDNYKGSNSDLYIKDSNAGGNAKKSRKARRADIRKRKIKKFFAIVLTMVTSFMLISFGCIFAYVKLAVSPEEQKNMYNLMTKSVNKSMEVPIPSFGKSRMTVLLAGVDKQGTRTDTIMIATVNKKTNQVDLISIPRDTRILVPEEVRAKYNKIPGNRMNAGYKTKITDFSAYAAMVDKEPMKQLEKLLEDMLDINIDCYVKIDTSAFVEVVDELGGIDYDVPCNMYYYDPTQNLRINLRKGMQHLNGSQAEGLVRMRHCYVQEDYGRMETQQNFLKAMFKQSMEKVSVTNLPSLAKTILKYVDTDFNVVDLPSAISIATKVNPDSINTHTLPSRPATIEGISYVIHDQAATEEMINGIWHPEKTEAQKEVIQWGEY